MDSGKFKGLPPLQRCYWGIVILFICGCDFICENIWYDVLFLCRNLMAAIKWYAGSVTPFSAGSARLDLTLPTLIITLTLQLPAASRCCFMVWMIVIQRMMNLKEMMNWEMMMMMAFRPICWMLCSELCGPSLSEPVGGFTTCFWVVIFFLMCPFLSFLQV